MANIIINEEPINFSPSNADLWYRLTSASYSLNNFKYDLKLNVRVDGAASFTHSNVNYIYPPRPNGECLYTPHSILNSYYDRYVNPFINDTMDVPGNIIEYNIDYGYSYNPEKPYYDVFYYNSTNVGLTFSTPHGLLVGDKIEVDKSNKQVNIEYDGYATVLAVPYPNFAVIDKKWTGFNTVNGTDGGNIVYLNRRLGTSSTKNAFNGTRQYNERTKNFNDYVIFQSVIRKFVTNQPKVKNIRLDKYDILSFYRNSNTDLVSVVYNFYNDIGLDHTEIITKPYNYKRVDIISGTKNLTDYGIDLTNIKYYTIHLEISGSRVSEIFTYNIDRVCSHIDLDDMTTFVWLNRLGAYDYFTFENVNIKNTNINRSLYSKYLPYNYNMGDRSKGSYNVEAYDDYSCTSGWISDNVSKWLEELFTSPDVYVIKDNELYPIVVNDTSYKHKSTMIDVLYDVTINYTLSTPINIQGL